MGWWTLEATKQNSKGEDIELDESDLEHITECIKEGFTSGELVDGG